MSFREYMRLDGWITGVLGVCLFVFGLVSGHHGPVDAALSGVVMIGGTGVFMRVRHKVPFRDPRSTLVARLLVNTAAAAVVVVGLSFLTGFWLTYMDFAVWALAIGVIKLGPSAAAIDEQAVRVGTTYRVARRPLRGLVQLTEDHSHGPAGDVTSVSPGDEVFGIADGLVLVIAPWEPLPCRSPTGCW